MEYAKYNVQTSRNYSTDLFWSYCLNYWDNTENVYGKYAEHFNTWKHAFQSSFAVDMEFFNRFIGTNV